MSPVLSNRARGWRGVTPGSSAARRGGHELLRRRDLDLLGWLAEQYGARVDQLEILMDTMNPPPKRPSPPVRSPAGSPCAGPTTDNDWRMR